MGLPKIKHSNDVVLLTRGRHFAAPFPFKARTHLTQTQVYARQCKHMTQNRTGSIVASPRQVRVSVYSSFLVSTHARPSVAIKDTIVFGQYFSLGPSSVRA